jgi:hypothetical protein
MTAKGLPPQLSVVPPAVKGVAVLGFAVHRPAAVGVQQQQQQEQQQEQ